MIGFILTGHAEFSNGLASAVDMVAGDQPAFKIVPFDGAQAATYGDDLRAAISAMRGECEGVLVFVDLLGGTPFNQAMMISQDIDSVEVVHRCGVEFDPTHRISPLPVVNDADDFGEDGI